MSKPAPIMEDEEAQAELDRVIRATLRIPLRKLQSKGHKGGATRRGKNT